MVKGVNKNIIEVTDTGNEFFERAILFVRPGHAGNEPASKYAGQYLCGLKPRMGIFSKGRIKKAVTIFVSACAGAGICLSVVWFFSV